MSTATFRATLTNGQYKKGNFTDKDGSVYEGIHVFTTLNRRNQRIIPLVSTKDAVELSSMNPNSNIAQPSDVIAKINGNVFVPNSCPVGFNYDGPGGNFYSSSYVYQAATDLSSDDKNAYTCSGVFTVTISPVQLYCHPYISVTKQSGKKKIP